MMKRVQSGQARWSDDPYVALTGLAVCAGFALNADGGQVQMRIKEIVQLQQFIATCDDYTPSAHFPFTKDQLRRAWESIAEKSPARNRGERLSLESGKHDQPCG